MIDGQPPRVQLWVLLLVSSPSSYRDRSRVRVGKVDMTCGIYQIRCLVTGDRYIGSSRDIEKRLYSHQWELRRGNWQNSPTSHLQRAWNKHGEDSFVFEVLEQVQGEISLKMLGDLETQYLQQSWPTGYNTKSIGGQTSGMTGKSHSDLTRAKQRAAKLGRKLGPADPEVVRRRAESNRGKPRPKSEEQKEKIRQSLKKYWEGRQR